MHVSRPSDPQVQKHREGSRGLVPTNETPRLAFALRVIHLPQRHASMETLASNEPLINFHAPCVSPPATTMLILPEYSHA